MCENIIGSRVCVTRNGQDIVGRVMSLGCNGELAYVTYPDPDDREKGVIISVPVAQLKPASYLGGYNG